MRRVALLIVAVAGLACGRGAPGRGSPPADLVLTGGRIFTGDPARPWAEALAIRGDRIVAVGSSAEIAASHRAAARTVDVGGRLVIPGLNDAHVHEPETWQPVEAAIAGDEATAAEILAAVETAAAGAPAGAWIRGNLGLVAFDDPALDRDALDRVSPGHPVWLDNLAGHITIVDSEALAALGFAEDSTPPPGGVLGRDATGRLDGRVHEYARWVAQRQLYLADDDALARATAALSADAAAYGITTVQNMCTLVDHRHLARVLAAHPPAVRWRLIRFPVDGVARLDDVRPPRASDRVYVHGSKYILDGTPIERWAAMRADYADRPGWSGRLDFEPDVLRAILEEALRSGDRLHLHVSGDRSLDAVLDLMDELADDATWRAHRLVIEHGDALGAPDFERARRLGIVVVQNPSHFTLPELMRARLGEARAGGWFAIRSIARAGIPLALGSDGPLNPFLNILFATTNPTVPGEALSREEALLAYTRGSAFDEGLEADKGTLAPGMLADLAVLSDDLFEVPADRLPAIRSVLTIVGGTVVHDRLED
jgi:predicted amidohydrolase YtcJ